MEPASTASSFWGSLSLLNRQYHLVESVLSMKPNVLSFALSLAMAKKRTRRKKKTPAQTKKRWTKEQLRILKRLYKSHSNADIAKAVGRTVASIVYKAHKLGLYKGVRRLRKMGQENIRHRWGE